MLQGSPAVDRSDGQPAPRFLVDLTLANYEDVVRAHARRATQVHQIVVRGRVDLRAMRMVVPASIVTALGLPITGEVLVRRGRRRVVRKMTRVHVTVSGRGNAYSAVVEPRLQRPVIGAIVMDDLDLLIDARNRRLRPRDPRYITAEIE